jgi:osmotically inducible protein OsmC
MAAESKATTVWAGDLAHGRGTTSVNSGAVPDVEVTWAARTERAPGTTSPEELLAAAHSSCFSMALAHGLAETGKAPDRLRSTATVSFVAGEGVKSSRISVSGWVPELDQAGFEEAARGAAENCPISLALKGNVEVTIEATLET